MRTRLTTDGRTTCSSRCSRKCLVWDLSTSVPLDCTCSWWSLPRSFPCTIYLLHERSPSPVGILSTWRLQDRSSESTVHGTWIPSLRDQAWDMCVTQCGWPFDLRQARDFMTTLRATRKGKQQCGSNVHVQTGACQRTGARQALGQTHHSVCFSKTHAWNMLETLQFLIRSKSEKWEGRGLTVRLPSSLMPKRSVICHTITAMIWAQRSRLTYAAENSHIHHQTLDIHAFFRSQDWMVVLKRATGKNADFAVADFAIAHELELSSEKRWWFRFPGKNSRKSNGVSRQYTHKHCTYSAIQSLHKRGTHRTRLAQELHNIFVRLKRICHLVRACLTLCCSLTCRAPRAHLLPHSLFLLPRHQNTHYNRDNRTACRTKLRQCRARMET